MRSWLENELREAEQAWNDALIESGHASPRAKYWAGYLNAINNALHELEGMN
jgi:hypothetical protein